MRLQTMEKLFNGSITWRIFNHGVDRLNFFVDVAKEHPEINMSENSVHTTSQVVNAFAVYRAPQ